VKNNLGSWLRVKKRGLAGEKVRWGGGVLTGVLLRLLKQKLIFVSGRIWRRRRGEMSMPWRV